MKKKTLRLLSPQFCVEVQEDIIGSAPLAVLGSRSYHANATRTVVIAKPSTPEVVRPRAREPPLPLANLESTLAVPRHRYGRPAVFIPFSSCTCHPQVDKVDGIGHAGSSTTGVRRDLAAGEITLARLHSRRKNPSSSTGLRRRAMERSRQPTRWIITKKSLTLSRAADASVGGGNTKTKHTNNTHKPTNHHPQTPKTKEPKNECYT